MRTMSPGEPYNGLFEVMLCPRSRPAPTKAKSAEMLQADLRLMSLCGTRRHPILVGGAAPALATRRLIWLPSNTRSRGKNQPNLVAGSQLGKPDQPRIIRQPLVGCKIPVLSVSKPDGVSVEKSELRALAVQVGVDVVLLGHRRQFAVVEQPNQLRGLAQRTELHLVADTLAVDVLVEAVVEQIVAVAAARVGRANPNRAAWVEGGIGAPRHFLVCGQAHDARQVNVPTFVDGSAIGRAVLGQEIIIIAGEEMGSCAPLFEVIEAGNCLSGLLGPTESRQQQACQNGGDGNHHQQLDQRKGVCLVHGAPEPPWAGR